MPAFFCSVWVTTFLEFMETWKCQEKRPKVRESLGNLCSQGNLIVAAHQNGGNQNVHGRILRSSYNLPVLHSYTVSHFL